MHTHTGHVRLKSMFLVNNFHRRLTDSSKEQFLVNNFHRRLTDSSKGLFLVNNFHRRLTDSSKGQFLVNNVHRRLTDSSNGQFFVNNFHRRLTDSSKGQFLADVSPPEGLRSLVRAWKWPFRLRLLPHSTNSPEFCVFGDGFFPTVRIRQNSVLYPIY